MGILYRASVDSLGHATADEAVAIYENGKIYSASVGFGGTTSKGSLIGEYENGFVYSVSSSYSRNYCVATYGRDKICRVSSGVGGGVVTAGTVATYSSGKIYLSNGPMQYSNVIGTYQGDADGAGAAAAIALLHLTSNVFATDASSGNTDRSGNSSSGSGGGVPLPGCAGISFWWVFLIAVVGVMLWTFWKSHPVISCVIVSAALGIIVAFFASRKSKIFTGIIVFVISLVVLFNLADMSNRYHEKNYVVHLDGSPVVLENDDEPTYRGMGIYKNWKGEMYCYPGQIEAFCSGVVAVNASIVSEENNDAALFFYLGNPNEKKRAVITLHNPNNGQQQQFYGYLPDHAADDPESSMVPLKEVAKWLGFDVKLFFYKVDFIQIS